MRRRGLSKDFEATHVRLTAEDSWVMFLPLTRLFREIHSGLGLTVYYDNKTPGLYLHGIMRNLRI